MSKLSRREILRRRVRKKNAIILKKKWVIQDFSPFEEQKSLIKGFEFGQISNSERDVIVYDLWTLANQNFDENRHLQQYESCVLEPCMRANAEQLSKLSERAR